MPSSKIKLRKVCRRAICENFNPRKFLAIRYIFQGSEVTIDLTSLNLRSENNVGVEHIVESQDTMFALMDYAHFC